MSDPTTAREALLVEAIGDVAKLLRRAEALRPALGQTCEAVLVADTALRDSLAGFERRMAAITEHAKMQALNYVVARTNEAALRSIDQQSRAMADAARAAFGAELGPTMRQLQAMLQTLVEQRASRWEALMTHAAVAVVASSATWIIALYLPR